MEVVSTGVLAAAIEILGAENTDDDEVDFQISTLVDNAAPRADLRTGLLKPLALF